MNLIRRSNEWLPNVFDDFFNNEWLGETNHQVGVNVPAVNIKENDNSFSVEVAAPGKQRDDFKIELDHNLLTISAEEKEEHHSETKSERKEKFTRREFSYSSFKRSFTLPDTIDNAKISANYVDGVLKIELPKREEAKIQPKRLIEIG